MNWKVPFFRVKSMSLLYGIRGLLLGSKFLSLTLALVLITFFAEAQHESRQRQFVVDEVRGCAPFQLTITNANNLSCCKCAGASACQMTFEGTTSQLNTFTHTYNTPGDYLLIILYPNIGPDTLDIHVDANIAPAFEVYTCSGKKVSVKVTDKNYSEYLVDFGDASAPADLFAPNQTTSPHTYPTVSPPPYTISVHGRNADAKDNCMAQTESFDAISSIPAPFVNTLTALDGTSLKIEFVAAPHIQVRLEMAINDSNPATFQLLKTYYGKSIDTVRNLKLDKNFYCFRLNAFDPCSGNPKYSNVVCSQQFSATPQSKVNNLVWLTSSLAVSNYTIKRDQVALTTSPPTSSTFDDIGIVCTTNYCYQIITNYNNGSKSISQEKCVTAFSTSIPTLIDDGSAVVSDSQVDLGWEHDPAYVPATYFIRRSGSGGPFEPLTTSTTPDYTDAGYSTSGGYCYRISYSDQCGNVSPPGEVICPIRLTGFMDLKNVITLKWNSFVGWKNGVKEYTLRKFSQSGNVLGAYPLGTDTSYVDDQIDYLNQGVSYEVTATAIDGGLTASVSNTAKFIKKINLFFPTAFTPNGDKLNDGFTVSGHYIDKMELNIFDRWGTLIYAGGKDEAWNGMCSGKLMPETSYVWRAQGTDFVGQEFTQTGTIVLLNKPR